MIVMQRRDVEQYENALEHHALNVTQTDLSQTEEVVGVSS